MKAMKRSRSPATMTAQRAATFARPISAVPVPASRDTSPEEEVEQRDFLEHALGCLHRRERRVIEASVFEGLTFSEVAAELKISRERVRQLEARAMGKLRRRAEAG